MLKTTDEMKRTGRTGWVDEQTEADNGRTSGQADESGQKHGLADGRTGWRTGGLADGRTGMNEGGRADDGFPKVKLPI